MLIPAIRPFVLTVLLASSATAIAQTVASAGIPYTAVKKTTIIQKLTDGTTLTRESNTTEARDSQGRTMVQNSMGEMQGHNITNAHVMDPVARTATTWMSQGKQATRMHLPDLHRTAQQSASTTTALGSDSSAVVTTTAIAARDPKLRPEQKIEKLGGKTIAGVYAEGTRVTMIFPVGSFGNDKPVITYHETWMSPELKIVLLRVDDDPRTGTRISEVTNLDRGEPDPALFQVPDGYAIKDQNPEQN